jgi:hypothetical protein
LSCRTYLLIDDIVRIDTTTCVIVVSLHVPILNICSLIIQHNFCRLRLYTYTFICGHKLFSTTNLYLLLCENCVYANNKMQYYYSLAGTLSDYYRSTNIIIPDVQMLSVWRSSSNKY